ncbi:MAG TPA: hypothetical protein VG964_02420 [Candidatus Saccharimonadales bacterium]|nr:hypothetical protein [Candidatus Saccharimonadales bacterium]
MSYVAKTTNELEEINDLLHDNFLNADSIKFDDKKRIFSAKLDYVDRKNMKFKTKNIFTKKYSADVYEWELYIQNVISHSVKDDAKIGGAEVNTIKYNDQDGVLVIRGTVPFAIQLKISDLNVEVNTSNKKVGSKSVKKVFSAVIEKNN